MFTRWNLHRAGTGRSYGRWYILLMVMTLLLTLIVLVLEVLNLSTFKIHSLKWLISIFIVLNYYLFLYSFLCAMGIACEAFYKQFPSRLSLCISFISIIAASYSHATISFFVAFWYALFCYIMAPFTHRETIIVYGETYSSYIRFLWFTFDTLLLTSWLSTAGNI